ncbi:glycosyltransferase [Dankookia sp. P2]|uniref:glycosyltransferase n=1 Tax=Dankookia sp. P2 TaxID=3423955 RepID=UPI003D677282
MIREFLVDLTTLGRGFTGVSVYARNLAAHLETTFDCRILAPAYLAREFRRGVVCPEPIYVKRSLVARRPLWQHRAGISLTEGSFVYAPHMRGIWGNLRQVITIHDLIAQYYPTRNVIENAFNARLLPRIARAAVGVVTVSEASRRDIAEYFHIDQAKIAVVGNGLDLSRWTPAGLLGPEGGPPISSRSAPTAPTRTRWSSSPITGSGPAATG